VLQSNTGTGVQDTCVGFINNGAQGSLQQDLFDRCTEMVLNSFQLDGQTVDGSLGLSESKLNDALQQLAGEETIAPSTVAANTATVQTTNIGARLVAIRAGVGGLAIGGLTVNGQKLQANVGQRGGAAGDPATPTGKLGLFVNGNISTGSQDATAEQNGFDLETYGVTAGADYRFTDSFVLGGALGYNHYKTDFNTSPTVAGGKVEQDT
jgi:outer membrane lipase/esterase